ncbi:MAG TPA: hypothetical protein VGK74_03240 [Symbiobacteriaceae bacterium]
MGTAVTGTNPAGLMARIKAKWLASLVLVLGVGMLGGSALLALGPQDTEFQDTTLDTSEHVAKPAEVCADKAAFASRRVKDCTFDSTKGQLASTETTVDLTGLKPTVHGQWHDLTFKGVDGTLTTSSIQILDQRIGLLAVLGALLAVLASPIVFIQSTRLKTTEGKPVQGWTYLLVEKSGLSLARLQLVIFFVPVAVVYLALAFPKHSFPNLPASVWELLGIGGATAAVSSVMTKNPDAAKSTPAETQAPAVNVATLEQDAAALEELAAKGGDAGAIAELSKRIRELTEKAKALSIANVAAASETAAALQTVPQAPEETRIKPPRIEDLFEDPTGMGDISRYQSLVICGSTAVVFLFLFVDTWSVPTLPPQVLQLLGASIAVYLGTKGIQVVKAGNAK